MNRVGKGGVSILLLLVLSATVGAATWIEDFDGQPEAYRLERNGQAMPVEIYQELQVGDRLVVTEQNHTLWVRHDDGSRTAITSERSPYPVQQQAATPGIVSNLISWAGSWLNTRWGEGRLRPVVSTVSRGGEIKPITVPLVLEEPAHLVAGDRPLHLAWEGGYPPFRLRLVMQARNSVVLDKQGIDLEGVNTWHYRSEPVPLAVGRYRLEIGDGKRRETVDIEVVPSSALPVPPAALEGSGEENNVEQTVYAWWLAAQNEAWMLEAYQRAAELADSHAPARILKHSLATGDRPQLPARARSAAAWRAQPNTATAND